MLANIDRSRLSEVKKKLYQRKMRTLNTFQQNEKRNTEAFPGEYLFP